MFPSALKNQLTQVLQKGFVVKRSVFQKCLELYPMPAWEKESERMDSRMSNRWNLYINLFGMLLVLLGFAMFYVYGTPGIYFFTFGFIALTIGNLSLWLNVWQEDLDAGL